MLDQPLCAARAFHLRPRGADHAILAPDVAAVTLAEFLLPWGLGFAAGAMIFVISHEIIPETHRKGFELEGTFGLMIGFVLMMFLDVTLA
jgi:zinc transporter ZupT